MPLLVFLAVFGLMRWVHQQFCPEAVRLVDHAVKRVVKFLWKTAVSNPMKEHGWLVTLWFWQIGFAVAMSCGGLLLVPTGQVGAALVNLVVSAGMWWSVVWLWRVIRRKAIRRYTPRPLPSRHEGRR